MSERGRIAAYLRDHPGATDLTVSRELHVSRSTVWRARAFVATSPAGDAAKDVATSPEIPAPWVMVALNPEWLEDFEAALRAEIDALKKRNADLRLQVAELSRGTQKAPDRSGPDLKSYYVKAQQGIRAEERPKVRAGN